MPSIGALTLGGNKSMLIGYFGFEKPDSVPARVGGPRWPPGTVEVLNNELMQPPKQHWEFRYGAFLPWLSKTSKMIPVA